MIPKVIHYCWFGRNQKPKLALKCIKSWQKKCKGFEIIEWNEDNFDIPTAPLYVRQAYEAKKWAFVSDYVRLWVVFNYGGIYFDTDVKLVRKLGNLLNQTAFFGFEDDNVNTGLGFGAEKHCKILKKMLEEYNGIPFKISDNQYDLTPCPIRNTSALVEFGLITNGETQTLDDNVLVLSKEYMCPIDYESGIKNVTKNTVSIHLFSASWHNKEQEIQRKKREKFLKQLRRKNRVHFIIKLPNLTIKKVIGEDRYSSLKRKLKG